MGFQSICLGTLVIRQSQFAEIGIMDFVCQLLPEHPVVVQGGCYSEVLKRLFYLSPGAKVYIFEPNPSHQELPKNFRRVEVLPYALNDVTGKAPFYISKPAVNPRVGSLLPAKEEWKWYYTDEEKIEVDCVNLDDWAQDKKIDRIDCLWLNIGGLELKVLQSIPELLPNIRVLFLEAYEQEFREGAGLFDEIKGFLESYDLELIQNWNAKNYQGYAVFAKKGLVEVQKW